MGNHVAVTDGHQRLWRRANDLVGVAVRVLTLQQVHVRARVDLPKNPVHLERTGRHFLGELLRQHNLKNVAIHNVLLGRRNHFEKFRLFDVGARGHIADFRASMQSRRRRFGKTLVKRIETAYRFVVIGHPRPIKAMYECYEDNFGGVMIDCHKVFDHGEKQRGYGALPFLVERERL